MPDSITCSDAACGATINTVGKEIGEAVQCPKCGKENKVLATFGDEFDISGIMPADDEVAHPARIKCTACGALLGVRDAVCKKCGADVRSGVSQVRITREEKEKRGLFSRKPKTKPAPPPPVAPRPAAGARHGTATRKARGAAPAAAAAPAPRPAAGPKRTPVRVVQRKKSPLVPILIGLGALIVVLGGVVGILALMK